MNLSVRPSASPGTFPARFTAAEFVVMIETGLFDDMAIELIEGELQRMPPAGNDHARRQTMVAVRLAAIFGEALVRVEAGMDLGGDTLVAADVALLHAPLDGSGMIAARDVRMVVDVAETTVARDTTLKRLAYAIAGVPLYWGVDARRSVVHAYADPRDGDYVDVRTFRFGERIAITGTDAAIAVY